MQFTYENVGVGTLSAESELRNGKYHAKSIMVGDRECQPTARFWNSFHGRFRIGPNVYNYYSHNEVFDRIKERTSNREIRVTIKEPTERRERPLLLAISSPMTAIMRYDALAGLMAKLDVRELKYSDGIVSTEHAPRVGSEA